MNIVKFTTTSEEENIDKILDKVDLTEILQNCKYPMIKGDELINKEGKETILGFKNYGVNPSHPHKALTRILDLLKSTALSEVTEQHVIDILKGKSYVKKVVTTEYFIIDNDGVDLTEELNDDYIKFLASDDPESLPRDKQFYYQGDRIIDGEEWDKLMKNRNKK